MQLYVKVAEERRHRSESDFNCSEPSNAEKETDPPEAKNFNLTLKAWIFEGLTREQNRHATIGITKRLIQTN